MFVAKFSFREIEVHHKISGEIVCMTITEHAVVCVSNCPSQSMRLSVCPTVHHRACSCLCVQLSITEHAVVCVSNCPSQSMRLSVCPTVHHRACSCLCVQLSITEHAVVCVSNCPSQSMQLSVCPTVHHRACGCLCVQLSITEHAVVCVSNCPSQSMRLSVCPTVHHRACCCLLFYDLTSIHAHHSEFVSINSLKSFWQRATQPKFSLPILVFTLFDNNMPLLCFHLWSSQVLWTIMSNPFTNLSYSLFSHHLIYKFYLKNNNRIMFHFFLNEKLETILCW